MSRFCMGCMEQVDEEYEICPHCGYMEGTVPEQALHLVPGTIIQERYIIGRTIGYGGFGVTYIGWDALLECKVAIKEYLPSEFSTRVSGVSQVTVFNGKKGEQFQTGLQRFVEEAKGLAKFNDVDGIVQIFDAFEENNTAYIVMEYLQGETLAARLEREDTIPAEEAVTMLLPVIDSLQLVHERGMIHRDLAPDNLFITHDGTVKVIDFGSSHYAVSSVSRSLTVIVKQGYSPEEQYHSRKKQGSYTDVYAIAATLYKAITGITPPDALERYAFAEKKKKDSLEPLSKYCPDIDENFETAILNAMNIRIQDRTQTMQLLRDQLISQEPVVRVYGNIKKTDSLRWPLWAKVTVACASLLMIVFGILFATGTFGSHSDLQTDIHIPEGMTRVPSVISQTIDAAEDRLNEASLLYLIIGKDYSEKIPANFVLNQDLAGGILVEKNSIVGLSISAGEEMSIVPHIKNRPEGEGIELLENARFQVSRIEQFSNSILKGHIIAQSATPLKEMEVGTVITIVISKGQNPNDPPEGKEFQMPDFLGKNYEEVLSFADENGLTIKISGLQYSGTIPLDGVLSQNIPAGSISNTGDTLEIVLSLGKQSTLVPDVCYYDEEAAKTLLHDRGLNVTVEYIKSDTVAENLVVSQSPSGGMSVDLGATIHLLVSRGAASFDMPEVTGMKEAEAQDILHQYGLSVSLEYQYSTTDAGIVLEQSIDPDTKVCRGMTVILTISSGEETFVVPDVIGKNLGDAEAQLKNSGFQVTVNKVFSEEIPENTVMNQNPAAGSSQAKGSNVILTVSCGQDVLTGLQVRSRPKKTTYFVGETLYPSGLSLHATYKSGREELINGGITCSPMILNTAGTTKITAGYGGLSASFEVSVIESELSGVQLKSKPQKLTYYVGDTLDMSGLVLTAIYTDDHSEEVYGGFTCSPMLLDKAGQQEIRVSYYGKETKFTVTVQEPVLTGIEIKKLPTKLSYYLGDSLDPTGMVLNAIYENNKKETVYTGFSCTPTIMERAGTQVVTVSYMGKATTFEVVVANAPLKSIEVTTMPKKQNYFVGETLDTTGLTLTATYGNDKNETKVITGGFTCSPMLLETPGTQKITVSYGGLQTSIYVQVEAIKLVSIEVSAFPKTEYYVGDSFDPTGMLLRATYNNGETKVITDGFTCSPMVLETSGTQKITVSYGGLQTGIHVQVEEIKLVSIDVAAFPKTEYYVGDPFDPTGLVLRATYNNGETKVITGGFTCSPMLLETPGTQKITISYGKLQTSIHVQVEEIKLASIEVADLPKTEYFVGDSFDPTGLVLCATYNNGDTKMITKGYSCSPTTFTKSGEQTVRITYEGKTADLTVTVNEILLESIVVFHEQAKHDYVIGDSLDLTGLYLEATYNNQSKKTVTSGFTCTPKTLLTEGTQIITVAYGGKTDTFTVTVKGKIRIKFFANGGVFSSDNSTAITKDIVVGDPIGELPVPQKEHYNFVGWYTANEGGEKISESTTWSKSGEVTLYAHWELKPESDWVPESSVPTGAVITRRRWTYKRKSTSSDPQGWTLYDTVSEVASVGAWSNWSDTPYASGDHANIEIQETTFHIMSYKKTRSASTEYEFCSDSTQVNKYEVTADVYNNATVVAAGTSITVSAGGKEYTLRNTDSVPGRLIYTGLDTIPYICFDYDTVIKYRHREKIYVDVFYFKLVVEAEGNASENRPGIDGIFEVISEVKYRE